MEITLFSPALLAMCRCQDEQGVQNQSEFSFGDEESAEVHVRWLDGRKMAAAELARRMGLPLGHKVEVWLYGGIRLRGTLRLQEEVLFIEEDRVRHLELTVDKVAFAYREMGSRVRLD